MKRRVKVFDNQFEEDTITGNSYDSNGNVTAWDSYSYTALKTVDYIVGYDIPNFHKRRAAGEVFNTPFQKRIHRQTCIPGFVSSRNPISSAGWDITGDLITYFATAWDIFPSWAEPAIEVMRVSEGLLDYSKQQALSRINSSEFSFGEDVAEFKKTLESLSKIFKEIKTILLTMNTLIRQLIRQGKSPAKAFSQVWLRARYEIRPLLISAENIITIYNEGLQRKERTKSSYFQTKKEVITNSWQLPSAIPTATIHYSQRIDIEYKAVAGILYLSPGLTPIQELGLGVRDVLPTIWAITRFSFLIDRFIDFSSMIRGIQHFADPNVNILTGWTTSVVSWKDSRSVDNYTDTKNLAQCSPTVQIYDRVQDISRNPWLPVMSDTIPTFQLDLSLETLTDLGTIFGPKLYRSLS